MKTTFDPVKNRWEGNTVQRLPRHDLVFGSPVNDPKGGLPIGDGDICSLLWAGEDRLHIHVNKSDLWDDSRWENDVFCAGFEQEENLTSLRHGGEITLGFDSPCFDTYYQQCYDARLALGEAAAQLEAVTPFSAISLEAFACTAAHTTVLTCRATFVQPQAPSIVLSRFGSRNFWRWYEQMKDDPTVGLDGTQAYAEGSRLYVTQQLNGTCFCLGLAVESPVPFRAECIHSHSCRLVPEPATEHRFTLYYTIALGEDVAAAKVACAARLDEAMARGKEALQQSHREEWAAFWNRSYIDMPDDYIENIYYLSLYYLNSQCRGAYPPHFTQGLWGFRHDFVPWNYYFFYNMQHMYGPLNASGHGELAANYYRMRRDGLEAAQRYAGTIKGLDGAFYHDVTDRYGRGADYDSHNFTPGPQIAMAMWRYYRYSGDEAFLRDTALPVMRQTAALYLSLLKKEEDGLYHIHGTTAYEANPPTSDTITDLAMIRVLFTTLEGLTDGEERARYQDVLGHLPDYTLLSMEPEEWQDGVIRFGIGAGQPAHGDGKILSYGFDEAGVPLRKNYGDPACDKGGWGFPDVEMAPIYPSGQIGLAQQGTPLFEALTNQVLLHRDGSACMHWCMMPLYLARMGLAEQLAAHLPQMLSAWQVYPNGFDGDGPMGANVARQRQVYATPYEVSTRNTTRDKIHIATQPFRYFDFETTPIVAHGATEALLQSYDGILRICPATRAQDPVAFRLYAEGGFCVQAEVGESGYVITVDSLRGERCLLKLPAYADGDALHLYRPQDGKTVPTPPTWITVGSERVLDLTAALAGGRVLLCSQPVETLETVTPEPAEKNRDMKRCGEAVLGSPALFK